MTLACVPLKKLPDGKGQNFYPGVCSLFFFHFLLIFILMSNENQICSLHFIPLLKCRFHHLHKLLTPLQQYAHVSPVITTDGQILAPLLSVCLCSQSHWNHIFSSSTSLVPQFVMSTKYYGEKRAFLDLCKAPEWCEPPVREANPAALNT